MEAINCFIKLKSDHFDQAWLESIMQRKLEEFSSHQRFSIRIHTLFCIAQLKDAVSEGFLNDQMFKKFIKKLAADPVPNIRFKVAQTIHTIHPRLSNSSKLACVDILKKNESDDDFDVKFYSSKTL
mmetsp:Transcript_22359/g.34617  ORF Transcript_22359/g.34617 Transcript_22359/m.34617 type:complete len:126 (+) Transcript_22359:1406-1783(+)